MTRLHCLIIGGAPRETVDGVRVIMNNARSEHHGHQVAEALKAKGITVTLIESEQSTASLLQIVREALSVKPYDVVLQLASIAGICPAEPSDRKWKIKRENEDTIAFEVKGNINLPLRLMQEFPSISIMGYTLQQEPFERLLRTDLANWWEIIRQPVIQHSNYYPQESAEQSMLLKGVGVLVTSGPTMERLTATGDMLTNNSSGKQGAAIALAMADMGAEVILVSGIGAYLPLPHPRITVRHVSTTEAMLGESLVALPVDIAIGAAAVADFRLEGTASILPLEQDQSATLKLCQNPDIIAEIANHAIRPKRVIGFAAETQDILNYAKAKRLRKNLDAICANQVGNICGVEGKDQTRVSFITHDRVEELPEMSKYVLGIFLGNYIAKAPSLGK